MDPFEKALRPNSPPPFTEAADFLLDLKAGFPKIAMPMAVGMHDLGMSWYAKFQGTPMQDKALKLMEEEAELDKRQQAMWRKHDAERRVDHNLRDRIQAQRTELKLQLARQLLGKKKEAMLKLAEELQTNDPGGQELQGPPIDMVDPPSGVPGPREADPPPPSWLMKDVMEDSAAKDNIIGTLEQRVAEQAQALSMTQQQAQEAGAAAEQHGAQLEQTTQQLQMSQQESLAAREEAAGVRESIMRMRQAIQGYREQLQNIALQDPTPPEVIMQGPTQPPVAEGSPPPQMEDPQAAVGAPPPGPAGQAAGQPPPAMPAQQPAGQPAAPAGGPKATPAPAAPKPATKTASANLRNRVIGALAGAGMFAAAQGVASRAGRSGKSKTEIGLENKVRELGEQHANRPPGALGKYRAGIKKHQLDIARTSREHPAMASALAAIAGAAGGAAIAPSAAKRISQIVGALRR